MEIKINTNNPNEPNNSHCSRSPAVSPVAMMSPGAESLDRMGILLSWMLNSWLQRWARWREQPLLSWGRRRNNYSNHCKTEADAVCAHLCSRKYHGQGHSSLLSTTGREGGQCCSASTVQPLGWWWCHDDAEFKKTLSALTISFPNCNSCQSPAVAPEDEAALRSTRTIKL